MGASNFGFGWYYRRFREPVWIILGALNAKQSTWTIPLVIASLNG